MTKRKRIGYCACAFALLFGTYAQLTFANDNEKPVPRSYAETPAAPAFQSWNDANKKSSGCISCHTQSDRKTMHASEAVVLGCTDCHGGDAGIRAPAGETYDADVHHDKRDWSSAYQTAMDKAHVLPRYPDRWPTSANPQRSYTAGQRNRRSSCASSIPVIFASPTKPAAPATCRSSRPTKKPDGERGHVLGRSRVQQRHPAVQAFDPRRGLYQRRQSAAATDSQITPDANMLKHGILPKIYPLPAWEVDPARRHLPRVRARRSQHRHDVSRNSACLTTAADPASGRTRPARHPPVQPRPRHRLARRDPGAEHPQDPAERSVHLVHGHQRPARRLSARRAAPPATWSTPTTASRCHSAGYAKYGNMGMSQDSRSDDSTRRIRPSAQARVHARDPDQPVHDLPHAPAEHVPEHLARLHDVGLRVRRAVHVAEAAEISDRRTSAQDSRPQSRRQRRSAANGPM